MRFIGKIATLPVRRHIEEWDDRAQQSRVVQQGIMAIFEHGQLSEHELAQGLEKLGPFTGLPILEDDQVAVSPRKLIRVYDTDVWAISEQWDADTKTFVEESLLKHPLYGQQFIAIETPRVAAPWPAYDKLVAKDARSLGPIVKKILAKIEEDEYEPALVLAYERENLNRPKIVEALEAVLPADAGDDIDLIAAAAAAAGSSSADDLITA